MAKGVIGSPARQPELVAPVAEAARARFSAPRPDGLVGLVEHPERAELVGLVRPGARTEHLASPRSRRSSASSARRREGRRSGSRSGPCARGVVADQLGELRLAAAVLDTWITHSRWRVSPLRAGRTRSQRRLSHDQDEEFHVIDGVGDLDTSVPAALQVVDPATRDSRGVPERSPQFAVNPLPRSGADDKRGAAGFCHGRSCARQWFADHASPW